MRVWILLMLIVLLSCLMAMLAELAFGAPPDMGDPIVRAALSPDSSVRICTCVDGPLADEIEKLRTQVRLLRAEAQASRAAAPDKRGRKVAR